MRFLKRSIRNQLVVFLLVATIVPIGVSMYITYVYTREDEIGHLSRRFQSMMNTINDLILREYRLELANKTTQLRMLQAQINPHFINNALQSIGTLALQHEAPKVYALLASLAKMMHYAMHTDETIVPLEKELEHLNYYLQLQKQRFDDKFSYRYDIGEATRTIPVPKKITSSTAIRPTMKEEGYR